MSARIPAPLFSYSASPRTPQDAYGHAMSLPVWVNSGTMYGDGDFLRINLACPRSTLTEGVSRMPRGLKRLAERQQTGI